MNDQEYRIKAPEPANVTPKEEKSETAKLGTPVIEKSQAEERNQPHGIQYFDISTWGELLLEPRLDIHGIKDKVLYIEDFVSNYSKKAGLKEDFDTFSWILGQIEQTLGITKHHNQNTRIEKAHNLIKQMKKSETRKIEISKLIERAQQEINSKKSH